MKILISIPQQALWLFTPSEVLLHFPVSTASVGVSCIKGSGGTPVGRHQIRAKIGEGLPINSVLVGRRPTGEIYSETLAQQFPQRDWILTRILWLSGLERGVNRLGDVDTMQRYIYIHGTPDSEPMGVPQSHGCIRMRNSDLVCLFDEVAVGTEVEIVNHPVSLELPIRQAQ